MTARIIDGKAVAQRLRGRLAERIATLHFRPGLAVVLVGDDPASARLRPQQGPRRRRAPASTPRTIRLPADTREAELLTLVEDAERRPGGRRHPGAVAAAAADRRQQAVIAAIDPAKDVDGFHPMNVGPAGRPAAGACAVHAARRHAAARAAGVELAGARAVVARPLAHRRQADGALLLARRLPPSPARTRRTRDLPAECRRADILVAAVGRPEMVRGDWIKPGRHRHRRRHQPRRRRQAGRRRGLRRGAPRSPARSPRCPAASGR